MGGICPLSRRGLFLQRLEMKVKSAGTSGWGLYGTVAPSLDKGFVYIALTSEPYHYKRV